MLWKLSPPFMKRAAHRYMFRLKNMSRDISLNWKLERLSKVEGKLLQEARAQFEADYRSMTNPLVSITIPTYNRGALMVERSVKSAMEQTYTNIEIVVVGDGCTDNTEQLIAAIKDPRIRFLNLSERGKYPDDPRLRWYVAGSASANKSLEIMQWQWAAWCDDDDIFTPNHIERLLEFAQKTDSELVFARSRIEKRRGEWVESGGPKFPTGYPPYKRAGVPHSTVMYRSYLRFFKYFSDSYKYGMLPTDNLLWQRMGRAGVRANFLNEVVSLIPLRPGQDQVAYLGSFENT